MRAIAVIQARLSSQRLPGKILLPLHEQPLLQWLVEALGRASQLDGVIIATSNDGSDDATARFAGQRGVSCYRGSLDNVAERLLGAGEASSADAIVRISGDSPMMDPQIVDRAVALFRERPVAIVTNVRPRSFPKGQSVEVIALDALRTAVAGMTQAAEREHVTPYLYAHPQTYAMRAFSADPPRPEVQLCVDDLADYARAQEIFAMLQAPPWQAGWRACVEAYDQYMAREQRT